jgi:stage III sporulation protein AG
MKINIKKLTGDIPKKKLIYILGAIGVLLILLPSFFDKEEKSEPETEQSDYCAVLEDRLEEILPKIEGVGNADVMVTAKNYGEKRLAKDEDGSTKKTVVLNQKGGGEEPEVLEEFYPEIQGVIIAADGGKSSKIKEEITEAVSALLGVETYKIKVFERKSDK